MHDIRAKIFSEYRAGRSTVNAGHITAHCPHRAISPRIHITAGPSCHRRSSPRRVAVVRMHHPRSNGNGGVQPRRPSEHGSPHGGKLTPGRGYAVHKATKVLHPEQNNNEWRRWDQNHGHMLWVGDLQEDWNNATIAGFFRYYGAEITVTRKGQDNYCFVTFPSTEEAKNFMAKYNHQPLPGKLGNSNRFNIRPRTRPRWYRGAEHHSGCTIGSGRDDDGRGRGSGVRDSRDPRLETRTDELVGNKRQQFREVKTERLSHQSRQSHQSHQTHQGPGVGTTRPADVGYYGPGKGDSDRGGYEERAPRRPPASQQRGDPEHDFKGRVAHGKHYKDSRGVRLRSRSLSRSRRQLRQRSRSGSPPPGHRSDKRCRSTSSGKGQECTQTRRRRYDPSLKQVRVPDSVVDGGISDRGSQPARSTFAATARSNSKGDGSLGTGQGRKLPQPTPIDRGGMNSYDGYSAKRNLTAANSRSGDFIARVDGSACRWPDTDSEKVGGEKLLGDSVRGAGRRGAEHTTAASSGELVTLPSQRAESGVWSSGLDQGDTEHLGWGDGLPNEDETSASSRQRPGDGVERDSENAITTHAWEAAAPVHGGTPRMASARSDSSWPAGGTVTSNNRPHHGTKDDGKTAVNGVTRKESLAMHEAWSSGASPLPSPTALPPKFRPLQHGSQHQDATGKCAVLPAGSSRPFNGVGGGPNQPEEEFKEGSTTESVCADSLGSDVSGNDEGSRSEGGDDGDGHLNAEETLPGSSATPRPPGLEPPVGDTVDERGSDRGVQPNTSPPARRGTKHHSTTEITLAQVIDHHMESRHMNGVGSDREKVQGEGSSSCAKASSYGEDMASADNVRSKNHIHLNGKWPAGAGSSADNTHGSSAGCSAIVAAAWTNGCVLPLTEVAAPHMRLVAPVLAAEPEGRRVVIHTAAAVAAGAARLTLPDHRLEVTGTCQDGLLLELCPKEEDLRCSNSPDQREESAFLSACAGRLQATFDGLVKLDLEFDMVRLPHGEAVDIMGTNSSSVELMQWLNEGTTTLVRLSAPRAPPAVGACATDLVELRKALAHPSGAPFLGIDCNLWPLLPRTGLLGSFTVDIHPVVLPASEPALGGSRAHRPVIHLAVTLSDPGTPLGSRTGSLGGLHGGGYQPISGTHGVEVAGARGTTGSVVAPDAAAVDLLLPEDSPLRCVTPTCTAGGLTWRDVTGLRCVAAVNKLTLGSRRKLEGKLQLAERLHAAEIEGLAKRVTALPGVLLVTLAGRQGASADVIASRLCVELTIKGRNPAMLDTGNYLWDGAPEGQVAAEVDPEDPISNSSPPASRQRPNSVALSRAITTLLGQARSGAGLSGVNNGGSRAAGEHDVAGLREAAGGRQWCDMVVVHGCQALDIELLQPSKFGLGPAEAVSVFVDLVPQVCVNNLTPVNGADVRLLRSLLAARTSYARASEAVTFGYDGGDGGNGNSCERSSYFDTHGFLEEWLVAEEREQRLCRSFPPATSIHLNTALPYDLNVLKPVAEPLLRSVPPPTSGCRDSREGDDGCRSSIYALSRSVLRLLRLCEALHAPSVPATSVLFGLIRSVP